MKNNLNNHIDIAFGSGSDDKIQIQVTSTIENVSAGTVTDVVLSSLHDVLSTSMEGLDPKIISKYIESRVKELPTQTKDQQN